MQEITYKDAQIVRMTEEQVQSLGMLYPKKVFFRMETSGSPSAWTDYGEYECPNTGEEIVQLAKEIKTKHEECTQNAGWNFCAHIRVIF